MKTAVIGESAEGVVAYNPSLIGGELTALEAIDGLLAEEHATRENRRVGVALKTARLTPPKTLEGFDFSFQPSLDRGRILALAQVDFVARAEVVHFLGPTKPDSYCPSSYLLRFQSHFGADRQTAAAAGGADPQVA
jgi:IstB-like ATP binding protein